MDSNLAAEYIWYSGSFKNMLWELSSPGPPSPPVETPELPLELNENTIVQIFHIQNTNEQTYLAIETPLVWYKPASAYQDVLILRDLQFSKDSDLKTPHSAYQEVFPNCFDLPDFLSDNEIIMN